MIDHLELATENLDNSSAFYEATLKSLGYRLTDRKPEVVGFEGNNGKDLWIRTLPGQGRPHFAFRCENRAEVDRAYADSVRAGGRVKQAPALLPHVHANYYSGQVYDPDGHLIEFACHGPQ